MNISYTEKKGPARTALIGCLSLLLLSAALLGPSTVAQSPKSQPFVVEYYYKVKWGHADEFIRLFKKNHFPVLRKEQELGRILNISAVSPKYHATEDGRWDYRVTITWKDAATAHDNFDSQSLLKLLYPDQDTFRREEQRRFEILEAHWDVPLVTLDLNR